MSFKELFNDMCTTHPAALPAETASHRMERGLAAAIAYPNLDKRGDRNALRRIEPGTTAFAIQLEDKLSGLDMSASELRGRLAMVATLGLSKWNYPDMNTASLLTMVSRPLIRTPEAASSSLADVAEYKGYQGDYGVTDAAVGYILCDDEGETIAQHRKAIAAKSAMGAVGIGVMAGVYRYGQMRDYQRAADWLLEGPTGYVKAKGLTAQDYMRQGLGGLMRLDVPTLDQRIGIESPSHD